MNVTMNDIKKLREMTGAGLADCKKALAESEDMDGAVAYLRKKGQAVAAKRSDREASEGCVLVTGKSRLQIMQPRKLRIPAFGEIRKLFLPMNPRPALTAQYRSITGAESTNALPSKFSSNFLICNMMSRSFFLMTL